MNRPLLRALNLVIAAALAAAVVLVSKPWEVWTFDAAFVAAFAAALVLNGLLIGVWAFRHSWVLSTVASEVPPRRLGWLVAFSNTASSLTPAATGELARAWFLKRNFGVTYEQGGAAIVFERVFILGLMAVTALVAGMVAVGSPGWLVGAGVVASAAYVFGVPRLLAPWSRRLRGEVGGGRLKRVAYGIAHGGLQIWSSGRAAGVTALWSTSAFAIQGVIFFMAAQFGGLELDAIETWALVGGATAGGVVSALPFGLGAGELSAVAIGAALGFEARAVAATFVVYRLFLTFPLALAGALAYARLTGGMEDAGGVAAPDGAVDDR